MTIIIHDLDDLEDPVFAAWVLIVAISGFELALIALVEWYKEQYRELNKIRRR